MDVVGVGGSSIVGVGSDADVMRVTPDVAMRDAMSRSNGVTMGGGDGVRCTGAVQLMAAGVVSVTSTVTAREAEESHRGHTGGAKNDAENVEVHPSTRGSQRAPFSEVLIQEPADEDSYGHSVIPVSASQLHSWLGVRIDTHRVPKRWHDFAVEP
jgi:hypothetical protein